MGMLLLATFITGVFAVPEQQILNVFVANLPKTHLGQQSTTNHVTLNCSISAVEPQECKRVLANGTDVAFNLLPGSALVVTDVSWDGLAIGFEVGKTQTLSIFLRPSPSDFARLVFISSSTVGEFGRFTGSEHMTAGFVISWTAAMELQTYPFASYTAVLMSGYLETGPQITPIP